MSPARYPLRHVAVEAINYNKHFDGPQDGRSRGAGVAYMYVSSRNSDNDTLYHK